MNATHLRIHNANDFPIDDRHDGVPYVFHPGKDRLIPVLAGALIFGWRVDDNGNVDIPVNAEGNAEADWEHVKRRWGWNNVFRLKDEEMHDAVMRSNKLAADRCALIRIEPVMMALREVPGGTELPAPRDGAVGPVDEGEPETPAPRRRMKAE